MQCAAFDMFPNEGCILFFSIFVFGLVPVWVSFVAIQGLPRYREPNR
jgi:hypothetical protein